ncbi:UDP-glycosyltransferase 708G1 [Ricinus communis]|uniref:UDP-glycosyltransferase 708G1 n=1 Tax=Ricinus communis TaxID=3988 RepID=UPI00201A6B08|nr:UDP-glycosyltransferase 708G1 [Ricinus communis]
MSSCSHQKLAHIVLLPSAGMGHLTPFLRLAALLAIHNVEVTLITPNPTVSLSESQALIHFFTSFPHINQKQLHLLSIERFPTSSEDPFYDHMERICQSSHLLLPLLSSLSPPLSAVITDMTLAFAAIPITQALNLPNYVLFTSSAKMLALYLSFHAMIGSEPTIDLGDTDGIKIPSLEPIPRSWIPPPLLQDTNNLLKTYFIKNGKKMAESSGILVNTFDSIEHEVLEQLNAGKVIENLPPVIAIGPLASCESETKQALAWLDSQQNGSVLFVSFGSRTAISRAQLTELGEGLVRSGIRFLWMVKDKKVDKEDEEDLSQVIGNRLIERLKERGLVVKSWLNQEDVLRHSAIGGFLSHCGWNSVTEAVQHGIPILAWPQHGDQKINADIVERIVLGTWEKSWGWGGEVVVKGNDIAEMIKEMMGNDLLRAHAVQIREEARRAIADTGNSTKGLMGLIETWKKI